MCDLKVSQTNILYKKKINRVKQFTFLENEWCSLDINIDTTRNEHNMKNTTY